MDAPEELRDAVAVALAGGADRWALYPYSVQQDRLMQADAVLRRLKVEASERDVSVNWLVTRAIDQYMAALYPETGKDEREEA